jgi:hypothetical protein
MNMIPPFWTKQPSMKRRLSFDASKTMIVGDTIASHEAKIFNPAGQDISDTMLAGSANTDTVVYIWVQAGTNGSTYYLRIKITTTSGEIIEDDLSVIVKQRGQ